MISQSELIDFLMESLVLMDKSLEKNDVNSAIKKVHECIAQIKIFKENQITNCTESGIIFDRNGKVTDFL